MRRAAKSCDATGATKSATPVHSVGHRSDAVLMTRATSSTVAEVQRSHVSSGKVMVSEDERREWDYWSSKLSEDGRAQDLQVWTPSVLPPSGNQGEFVSRKWSAAMDLCRTVGRRDLITVIHGIANAERAPSTVRIYTQLEKSRRQFAQSRGFSQDDANSLILYLLHRNAIVGPASVQLQIASFKWMCGPLAPEVDRVVAAIRDAKRRTVPTVHKSPADLSKLQAFIEHGLSSDSQKDIDTAVMALLLYAALLRVSELVNLRWEDITVNGEDFELAIRRAKNDQLGRGRSTTICLPNGSQSRDLWNKWAVSRTTEQGFLFRGRRAGAHISRAAAHSKIKLLASKLGFPELTSHSFRAGAATTEAARGAPLEALQRRGRWLSSAGMAPYLRDSKGAQGGCTALL